jgi:hypothetical protein
MVDFRLIQIKVYLCILLLWVWRKLLVLINIGITFDVNMFGGAHYRFLALKDYFSDW